MISIEIVSEEKNWSKKIKKTDVFFRSICKSFPKKYQYSNKRIYLTLLLSNNKRIKKLNKKFRNKNKPTDVLSFPAEKKFDNKKNTYLGDIVISYEFMNKPKSLNNLDFKKRVIKIFVHGYLHLLGYDHIRLNDFKKMIKEEKKIYDTIKKKIIKFI